MQRIPLQTIGPVVRWQRCWKILEVSCNFCIIICLLYHEFYSSLLWFLFLFLLPGLKQICLSSSFNLSTLIIMFSWTNRKIRLDQANPPYSPVFTLSKFFSQWQPSALLMVLFLSLGPLDKVGAYLREYGRRETNLEAGNLNLYVSWINPSCPILHRSTLRQIIEWSAFIS